MWGIYVQYLGKWMWPLNQCNCNKFIENCSFNKQRLFYLQNAKLKKPAKSKKSEKHLFIFRKPLECNIRKECYCFTQSKAMNYDSEQLRISMFVFGMFRNLQWKNWQLKLDFFYLIKIDITFPVENYILDWMTVEASFSWFIFCSARKVLKP